MPYVPSLKTDGKSQDRILIDSAIEPVAHQIARTTPTNVSVLHQYKQTFSDIGGRLTFLAGNPNTQPIHDLAQVIFDIGAKYGYEGAFLGELNYAITRLIQRVPQIKVELGQWQLKDEIRYWLYAETVEALTWAAFHFNPRELNTGLGIGGAFEDIKDEYKRRVNPSYEAAQIVKSGDCYDTPYYNRLVRIVDEDGKEVGKILVDMVRSQETLHKDVLDGELVLRTKVNSQL